MKNPLDRIELVKAMDTIITHLNDEELTEVWLQEGIPDGYMDDASEEEILEDFCENDKELSRIIGLFQYLVHQAYDDDSGIYVDGVCN